MDFQQSAERKIANALSRAVSLHLEGSGPDDSVKTAVLEGGLNPNMADRVVEGFNIALTRAFLKTAQDKTDSFPTASKEAVRKLAFGDVPLVDHPEESVPDGPRSFWDGPSGLKVASLDDDNHKAASWGDPGPSGPRRDLPSVMRDVSGFRKAAAAEIEEARMLAAGAEHGSEAAISSVAGFFRLSENRGKFAGFEAETYSELGPEAQPFVEAIRKEASVREAPEDPARYAGRVFSSLDFAPQVSAVARAMELAGAADEHRSKMAALRGELDEQSRELSGIARALSGVPDRPGASAAEMLADPVPVPAQDLFGRKMAAGEDDDGDDDGNKGKKKSPPPPPPGSVGAFFKDNSIGRVLDSVGVGFPSIMDISRGESSGIEKDYEAAAIDSFRRNRGMGHLGATDVDELDNLRRQVILQDLMLNDEIISAQDPRNVARIYGTLLKINPRATLVPDITRSVLRAGLADSTVDPFTAEQFAKLEGAMAKNEPKTQDPAAA